MYTLIFWIIGCVGLSCDIPGTKTMYFETIKDCKVVERSWRLSNSENSSVCFDGIVEAIDEEIFYDKSKSK